MSKHSLRRAALAVDRVLPGIGRLTIRAGRMTRALRNELDQAIVRASEQGQYEQLLMLKKRSITPQAFLMANRTGAVGALRPSPKLTPLLDQWIASGGLRKASRTRYEQSWRLLLAVLPTEPTLTDLTPQWWTAFLASRNVTTSTLNRDRAAYLAFRNWARNQGLGIIEFPVKRFKEDAHRSNILTPEQVDAIKRNCRPDRWPLFWTLLETWARQGEVMNLRSDDVVVGNSPSLRIRSAPGAKGRGRPRYIPISPELANCLRAISIMRADSRPFPISRYTLRDWWDDLTARTGIKGVTLHGIRATGITTALDNGVPPVQVQKIAGHADITMTMRYYRNESQSTDAAAIVRTALRLGQQTGKPDSKEVTYNEQEA